MGNAKKNSLPLNLKIKKTLNIQNGVLQLIKEFAFTTSVTFSQSFHDEWWKYLFSPKTGRTFGHKDNYDLCPLG